MLPKSYLSYLETHPLRPSEWMRLAGKIEDRLIRLSQELSAATEEYQWLLDHLVATEPIRKPAKQAAVRAPRPVSPLRRSPELPLCAYFDTKIYGLDFKGTTVVEGRACTGKSAIAEYIEYIKKAGWAWTL